MSVFVWLWLAYMVFTYSCTVSKFDLDIVVKNWAQTSLAPWAKKHSVMTVTLMLLIPSLILGIGGLYLGGALQRVS